MRKVVWLQTRQERHHTPWRGQIEVLVAVDDSELDFYEKRFVALYQSNNQKFGYNRDGGGVSGGFATEEVRNKQKAPDSKWHQAQKQPATTAAKQQGLERAKQLDPDIERRRKENAKAACQTAEYRQNASKFHLVAQNRPETTAKRVGTWARKREERLMQLPLEQQQKERERMAKNSATQARFKVRKKAGIPTKVYASRKG